MKLTVELDTSDRVSARLAETLLAAWLEEARDAPSPVAEPVPAPPQMVATRKERAELYRQAIEAARVSGGGYRFAVTWLAQRWVLVSAGTLTVWARRHGTSAARALSPAALAACRANAQRARAARAREEAA